MFKRKRELEAEIVALKRDLIVIRNSRDTVRKDRDAAYKDKYRVISEMETLQRNIMALYPATKNYMTAYGLFSHDRIAESVRLIKLAKDVKRGEELVGNGNS